MDRWSGRRRGRALTSIRLLRRHRLKAIHAAASTLNFPHGGVNAIGAKARLEALPFIFNTTQKDLP
jgi:hypothetical protein